jgi:hypothetical protein
MGAITLSERCVSRKVTLLARVRDYYATLARLTSIECTDQLDALPGRGLTYSRCTNIHEVALLDERSALIDRMCFASRLASETHEAWARAAGLRGD